MKLLYIIILFALIIPMTSTYVWGQRGGTEDINIGVGELQKSSDQPGIMPGDNHETVPGVRRGRPGMHRGGTEDINIGVGELQETSDEPGLTTDDDQETMPGARRGKSRPHEKGGAGELKSQDDEANTGLLLPAVQKARRR